MTEQPAVSPLDVADWFFKKADTENVRISDDKIQHLLFLSQMHFALKERKYLMPALFVCDRSGFYEASVRSILKFGFPLMPNSKLSRPVNAFLELIWQKYASLADAGLKDFVCTLECWKQSYLEGQENIVDAVACTDSFTASLQKVSNGSHEKTKIMLSQRGPVKVSAWMPRKLNGSKK